MSISVIKVTWGDQTGTINADEAFLAADAIEQHVAVFELAMMLSDPRQLRTAKLALAYHELCKVAGIKSTPKEIRSALVKSFENGDTAKERGASFMAEAGVIIGQLLAILTDGADMGQGDEAQEAGNVEAPAS